MYYFNNKLGDIKHHWKETIRQKVRGRST